MSVAARIRNEIAKMASGAVFLAADLPSYETDRKATLKALSYYASSEKLKAKFGEINRIADGLYYKVETGLFGKRPPDTQAVIRALTYTGNKKSGFITGQQLFNSKGLSTQVPATLTLITSRQNVPARVDTPTIKIIINRQDIQLKEKDILRHEFAYILNNIETIQDLEKDMLIPSLSGYFEFIINNAAQFKKLYDSLIYKKTKALLGALLAQFQSDSKQDTSIYLQQIKQDLSDRSQYRWGNLSRYLSKKDDWNIVF